MRRLLKFNSTYFWPVVALLLCVLTLPFLSGYIPLVRFPRERIDIYLYPDYIRVEGYYYYRNPWPIPVVQEMAYPLPVERDQAESMIVVVKQLSPEERYLTSWFVFGSHRFTVAFPARGEVCLKTHYRQQTPKRKARYILVTTRNWHRPLTEAIYRMFPRGVKIISSSYPLELKAPGILGFEKTDFMPEEDWHFAWEVNVKGVH